ncbi:hypothetical protein SD436_01225 [Streptococcus sp. 2A/TPW/M5]
MKNEKKVDIEQANKVYFKSLANTRASAAMMINSLAGVFLFAIEILCFYSYDVSKGIKPFSHWFLISSLSIVFTILLHFSCR